MRTSALIAVILIAAGLAPAAQPPDIEIVLLIGNNQPSTLKKGGTVKSGTTVTAGAGGLIVFNETWPAERTEVACIGVTVFAYGASRKIVNRATQGRCEGANTPIRIPTPGQQTVLFGNRLVAGKADGQELPEVQTSQERWSAFQAWSTSLKIPNRMGPIVPNLNYDQGDYLNQPTDSAEACSALCRSDTKCRAMTFVQDQGHCWLKDSVPPGARRAGMFSAVKIR